MSVKVHTLSFPSPRGSTATHLLATRQSAVAMGVGSYRYRSGYVVFSAYVALRAW